MNANEYNWRELLKKGDKVLRVKRNIYSVDIVTGNTKTGSLKFESGDLLKKDEFWSRDSYSYEPYDEVAKNKLRLQEKKQKFSKLKEYVSANDLAENDIDIIIEIMDKQLFSVRNVLGEYVVDIIGDSVRLNKDSQKATKYKYEEAQKVCEEASRLLDGTLFNVYKETSRIR